MRDCPFLFPCLNALKAFHILIVVIIGILLLFPFKKGSLWGWLLLKQGAVALLLFASTERAAKKKEKKNTKKRRARKP